MPSRSTWYALVSIVLWATQALVLAKELPKLDLLIFLSLSFFFSALSLSVMRFFVYIKSGFRRTAAESIENLNYVIRNKKYYLLTICGALFTIYHFLLFKAIEVGPVIPANLLNFLWPLFFVILVQRNSKEKPNGIDATLIRIKLILGFSGCVLLLAGGINLGGFTFFKPGPILGLFAAVVWAAFSIRIKRIEDDNGFFRLQWIYYSAFAFITSVISLFTLSDRVLEMEEWRKAFGPALYFGLFPLGLAMVFYDKAVHLTEAQRLGRLIFLTPLLSTLFLLLFADTEPLNIGAYLGGALVILSNVRIQKTPPFKKIGDRFYLLLQNIVNNHKESDSRAIAPNEKSDLKIRSESSDNLAINLKQRSS